MSSILINNALLVTLNSQSEIIEQGSLFIQDGKIVELGRIEAGKYKADREIDARGNVVMPGLINAHHHLYSTLARGFIPPGEPARNFTEILEKMWWKLDLALEPEDVYLSALIAVMYAARAGCTTIIDHHASPGCSEGSLDLIEKAFREVGLNGCLCYEVSDRNVKGEGIEENERFIKKCKASGDDQIRALFGLHALMTLSTPTLEKCSDIAHQLDTGFHVHVAEAEIDVQVTLERYQRRIMDRFLDFGIPSRQTIFAHGIHFEAREMDLLKTTDSMLVNNPESNMNNGLGVTPILEMLARGVLVGIGTDGMSSHMISQARALYLLQRTYRRDPRVAFAESAEILLKNNRAICDRLFTESRGILAPGAQADVMIADYVPFTPLNADNFYGHLLYGLSFARVNTTIARGNVVVDNGRLVGMDEEAVRAKSVERAQRLWARIS